MAKKLKYILDHSELVPESRRASFGLETTGEAFFSAKSGSEVIISFALFCLPRLSGEVYDGVYDCKERHGSGYYYRPFCYFVYHQVVYPRSQKVVNKQSEKGAECV